MNRKITVTLGGAASIDGQAYKPGDQVETTLGTALQLVEMGVIAALPDIEAAPVALGEDPELHEKAKAMAETLVAEAVATAMTETTAELENERRRSDELALQLAAMTTERDTLQAQLEAAPPAAPAQDYTADLPGGEAADPASKKRGR